MLKYSHRLGFRRELPHLVCCYFLNQISDRFLNLYFPNRDFLPVVTLSMEVAERKVTSDNNQRPKFTNGDNWQTDLFIKVNGTWAGLENLLQIQPATVLKIK